MVLISSADRPTINNQTMMLTNLFVKRLAYMLGSVAVLVMIVYDISLPRFDRELRRKLRTGAVVGSSRRELSLDLGDGKCEWTPFDEPEEFIDFTKTVIAGYPSGDKRMVFIQMEALTGWPAIDAWEFSAKLNHPFIKTNYPHQAGIWGWEGLADQVVMVLRNVRASMIEYCDIIMDQMTIFRMDKKYNYHIAENRLYKLRHSSYYFNRFRDQYVDTEIDLYGWFVDYWMEGGLMRDVETNKITTPEHWYMLRNTSSNSRNRFRRENLPYDVAVGLDTGVTPSYDPHCTTISGGCEPIAIFSGELLSDYVEGPKETAAIASVLMNDDRMGKYVINNKAWDCIWNETIVHRKGGKTVNDRPQPRQPLRFGTELLEKMISEQTRLIDKYSGPQWYAKDTAQRLVTLLTGHRASLRFELSELNPRKLKDSDLLGPKTRRLMSLENDGAFFDDDPDLQAQIFEYLDSLLRNARMDKERSRAAGLL